MYFTLGIEKHEFLLSMISKVKTIIENIPAFDYRFLSLLPQKVLKTERQMTMPRKYLKPTVKE